MEQIIVPFGTEILQKGLKVTSNGKIPAFSPNTYGCDDGGTLTLNDDDYKTEKDGDFVLFMGVTNKPDEGYLAYASYCVLRNLFYSLIYFRQFK